MSETHLGSKVLVLSKDEKLINTFNKNSENANNVVTVVDTFSDFDAISSSDIIVYDVDLIEGEIYELSQNINLIQQANEDASVLIGGKRDAVNEALANKTIKGIVSRQLYKPVIASKLHMVLEIEKPKKTLITPEEPLKKGSSAGKYIAAGIAALALLLSASWFISKDDQRELVVAQPQERITQVNNDSPELSQGKLKIRSLLKLAEDALRNNALVSPERDNALHYYNKVIELDTYNTQAYDGKQKVLEKLRASLPKLLKSSDFTTAELFINHLVESEPFNEDNPRMRLALQDAIAQSNNGSSIEQNVNDAINTNPIIANSGSDTQIQKRLEQQRIDQESQTRLANSQALTEQITNAIKAKRLVSPPSNNAYSFLREGLQNNVISGNEFSSLKQDLTNALIAEAKQQVSTNNLSKAKQSITYIRSLDKNHAQLPSLITSIKAAEQEALIAKNAAKETQEKPKTSPTVAQNKSDTNIKSSVSNDNITSSAAAKASPAVIRKKYQPDYPRRALNFNIEGWVEVEYQVSETGKAVNVVAIQSEPKRIFNTAGINAVKRWEFIPAKDSAGKAILSETNTTKFNFSLDDT